MPIVKKKDSPAVDETRDIVPAEDVPPEVFKYLYDIGQHSIVSSGLTKDQVRRLTNVVKMHNMGTGATIIQTCSTRCTSYDRCPLAIVDRAPIGDICPIETNLYQTLLEDYKRAVAQKISSIESIKDIEQDPIILSLISQAIEIEIMHLRVNGQITITGLTTDVPVLAVDDRVEYVQQESAASRMKRDFNNRKDKVLRQLLATPEMVQKVRSLKGNNTISDQKRQVMDRAKEIMAEATVVEEETPSLKDV